MTQMQDIPKSVLPVKPATEPQKIPRIIWQTFESNTVPIRMYEAAMSWLNYNQDYEYRFHDKDDRVNFIQKNFDEKVLQAFNYLETGAAKSDLWRYCVLYVHGGVYVDIDMVCQRMLSKTIGQDDEFIVSNTPTSERAVFSAFLCSKPQHPFIKRAIDRSVRLILADPQKKAFVTVGPICLGNAINISLGRKEKDFVKLEVGQHFENGFSFRILKKRVKKEGQPSVMDGDEVVCLNKYEGYLEDLEASSVTYWKEHDKNKKMEAANKILK